MKRDDQVSAWHCLFSAAGPSTSSGAGAEKKEEEADPGPQLPRLSEQLNLDELWTTLGDCLKELARTPDHHAVLILQPAVEAFFIVHAGESCSFSWRWGVYFIEHAAQCGVGGDNAVECMFGGLGGVVMCDSSLCVSGLCVGDLLCHAHQWTGIYFMVHASDEVLWVGGGGALTYVQVSCCVQVSWIRAFLIQVLKLFLQRHDSSTLFSLAPNQGPGGPWTTARFEFFHN